MKSEIQGICGYIFFLLFDVAYGGKNCYNSNEYPQTFQCEHGCCGDKYKQYCCQITTQIIGSVLGGLIVVGVIVGVAIFCCKKKQKRQPTATAGILGRFGMRSTTTRNTGPPPLSVDPVTGRPIPVAVPPRRPFRLPQQRPQPHPQPNNTHFNPAYVGNIQMHDLQPPSYYPQPTGPMHNFTMSPTAPMPPPYEMTLPPPPYAIDKSVPPPPTYQSVVTPGFKPSEYNDGLPPPSD